MSDSDTFNILQSILTERFGIAPNLVQPKADLQSELNLDSVDAIDLLVAINQQFDVRIPEKAFDKIQTVEELVACVDRLVMKRARQ